ncbi:hypothetical protein FUA23_17565 [Neolewinella aurantiaca]|uniref:Uncharacterized protein n=1 Tax=Neolewinella aurantiaca TaxID=2602767 RepID=A0A5C7FC87_9BACT|nr:hypothetical protein [Neolewinella aurantiaca]TXF87739.1 hypothetical protein FUA23_17565 [Neolewinella aurantiaca]
MESATARKSKLLRFLPVLAVENNSRINEGPDEPSLLQDHYTPMPTDQRILFHPGLNPLWESMERDRRQQQYAAIVLMLLCFASIIVGATSQYLGWALLGGFGAAGALWWLLRIVTEQPLAYWRRLLTEHPESVVWVYGLVTERMPFGFKTVAIGTLHLVGSDGEIHTFGMKPTELKLVTKTLNRVLPHAEFGYSAERELRYRGEVTDFKGRDQFNQIK